MSMTTEQLVVKLQERFDDRLFEVLVRQQEHIIRRQCLRMVGDADTDDLFQEISISMFLHINSLRNPASFPFWLKKTVANACVDRIRIRKKLANFTIEAFTDIVEEEGEDECVEELFISMDDLPKLLGQLSAEDRQILEMKYIQKKTIREIQSLTDAKESTVKMRLKRSRQKLQYLKLKMLGQ
ncbi:sigma-70 family RNA polymerase sigma factor [Limibacter armeniacum]|uniref:RNA polymerase sigma factor n=1 Tax=Limibacter armeniacum TaxID=466084 RepID=UPI002FE5EAEC